MSQHYSYQRELRKQRYTNNGKESITELDLGWLDFGARMYQADLGRWFNVDPMAEKYYDMTPYKYGLNNPIAYTDPNGMTEVYGVEMDLGATGSVQNVFDASPDVMEGKNRYESVDDWVAQVGKDYVAELQGKLSSSDDGLNQESGRLFENEGDAYKFMWNSSFDADGNVLNEVAGFVTKEGVLVLPTQGIRNNGEYARNNPRTSYNDFLPLGRKNGRLYVSYQGNYLEVLRQVHTHPNSQTLGRYEVTPDIGVQNNLGVPITIIRTNGFYNLDMSFLGTRQEFFNETKSLYE